jgi:hypothetical protein
MMRFLLASGLVLAGLLPGSGASAGEADVVEATLTPADDGSFRLDATVRHEDTGWDHYADAFEVLTPDGESLGTRTLLHPHVDEQPFTRSLSGLRIPDGVDEIVVRAHDNVDGHGGAVVRVQVLR